MRVTLIGIGKVGLAYGTFIASKGHDVIGVEVNESYLESLKNGTYVCPEPGVQDNIKLIKKFSNVDEGNSDICIILVATPTCYAGYDHTTMEKVLEEVATKNHKTVLVSSTTQPGFMNRWINKVDNLYYNPLFIQLGNIIIHQETTKNVLIGGKENELLNEFFKSLHGNDVKLHYMSHMAAEISKLSLNCMITTKISFANMIAESMWRSGNDSETHKVLDFVGSDPRVGEKCLKAGWGYGGPCFPRDNRALCTFLRQWGAADYIPVATHETNERHAVVMALKTQPDEEFEDLNYKPNCPVVCTEESHKIKTLEIKKSMGK